MQWCHPQQLERTPELKPGLQSPEWLDFAWDGTICWLDCLIRWQAKCKSLMCMKICQGGRTWCQMGASEPGEAESSLVFFARGCRVLIWQEGKGAIYRKRMADPYMDKVLIS